MSKNIRIRTEPNSGDSHIKFQLSQDFDFLEILSLKISQEDVYRNFYSDYGVVVGRVMVNSGVGIPNARISIFIPLTDEDSLDPEISSLYPYSDTSIINSDGIRYNILPEDSQNDCHTPVGTFPNKNKLIDNDRLLEIHDKYYKYTTTTNDSGDFMLFGVPVGNYTLNVDVDLSDIGIYSQRPYDFIDQGNPEKLFTSSTKFKSGKNLNNLTQLKNRQVGINVIPFWGEAVSNEVGISRIDIDLNYNLEPKAIFIGALFGDNEKNSLNKNCRPRKKLGKVCEMSEGGGTLSMLRKTLYGESERFDIEGGRVIDDNGVWAYQIPMNLDYMVTNEYGELTPTEDTTKGIPTRSSVRFKVDPDSPGDEGRVRTKANYLVPHNPASATEVDYTFDERTLDIHFRDFYWNKIYTVKNHITRFQRTPGKQQRNHIGFKDVDDCVGTKNPIPFNTIDTDWNPLFLILCLIIFVIDFIGGIINTIIGFVNGLIFWGNPIKKLKPNCGGRDWTLSSEGWRDCTKVQIAEALGVFEMDFHNDWVNGSLYAYLLKYKKRKRTKGVNSNSDGEKFCGDGGGPGETGNYLINSNTYLQMVDDGVSEIDMDEGVIASYEEELYYKPMVTGTTNSGNLLYATDIHNLGSVFDCDWQGKPNIAKELIPTTYQFPEFQDISLIMDLECIAGATLDGKNSKNIKHMCEIGVDIEEDTDNTINEEDVSGQLIRNKLITLNNDDYSNTSVHDIDSVFYSPDYLAYRNFVYKNKLWQSFGESFYYYFGTIPNKSALDVMVRKYFAPCLKEIRTEIIIVGTITDVTEIGGEDGQIELTINGGTPFVDGDGSLYYEYEWKDSSGVIFSTNKDVEELSKGVYSVVVTDSNDKTSTKNFNIRGLAELQMEVNVRGSLPNVEGDGIIYITSISGGKGPYNLEVTGGNGPYTVEGLYNGVNIENLVNGVYTVTVTDSVGVSTSIDKEIYEIANLSISDIASTPPTCKDASNGIISFKVNGGTKEYAIRLTSPTGEVYSQEENVGLESGDYSLVVSDSYSQTTPATTITIANTLELVLTVVDQAQNTMTLTNAIVGTTYSAYNGGSLDGTFVASSTSVLYTGTGDGTYHMNDGSGCISNSITV